MQSIYRSICSPTYLETRVKFLSPHDISQASQQNSIEQKQLKKQM